jgi:hypothetical protein
MEISFAHLILPYVLSVDNRTTVKIAPKDEHFYVFNFLLIYFICS